MDEHQTSPKLPKLTPWGAYDPVMLLEFFAEADRAKMTQTQIADCLKVPLHRVIYFQHKQVKELQLRKAEQILNG